MLKSLNCTCMKWFKTVFDLKTFFILKINTTYCARTLHPGFSVDLHRKSFCGLDCNATTLCKSSTRISQTSFHLSHMQTVLQTDHFYEIISNICNGSVFTLLNFANNIFVFRFFFHLNSVTIFSSYIWLKV